MPMTKNTTSLDLLRYLYHETNTVENEGIAMDVLANKKLADEFDDFVEVKRHLDTLKMSPRDSVINNIIQLAK